MAVLHKLTAAKIKAAKPGDKLADGGGLRLDVDSRGNGSWILRFSSPVTRRERFMGLGGIQTTTLAEARDAAAKAREQIRAGIDPLDHRKEAKAATKAEAARSVSLQQFAERFIAIHEVGWRNPKHAQQWTNTLKTYVYPVIGTMPVADIDTTAVLKVIRPLWTEKPETASRIRGRLEMILSAARAEGLRTGENPAAWRGHLDHVLPSKRKVRPVQHHAAMHYRELPTFMTKLAGDFSAAALALRFIILTATRFGEATRAIWTEIDLEAALWTIPKERMKGGRTHVVPLSPAAIEVLKISRERDGNAPNQLVIPGAKRGRPISDVALANAILRHTSTPATTHGFRSTFRDWAGDKSDAPREVAEAALAHVVGNEVEIAYRRGSALEKRRALMQAWAEYAASH